MVSDKNMYHGLHVCTLQVTLEMDTVAVTLTNVKPKKVNLNQDTTATATPTVQTQREVLLVNGRAGFSGDGVTCRGCKTRSFNLKTSSLHCYF